MLKSYALTDIGRRRQLNQDFIYCNESPVGNLPNLFIVADGMGGHKAGDYASGLAVETVVGEAAARRNRRRYWITPSLRQTRFCARRPARITP